MSKKIAITGGHPSPALAVIDEIKESGKNWEIVFLGVKHTLTDDKAVSYEYKEVKRRNIPFYELNTSKWNRETIFGRFLNLIYLPLNILHSVLLLKKLKSDLLLTFGGYPAVPTAAAAKLVNVPIVLHEQTLHLGLANSLFKSLALKLLVSWPQTRNELATKDKVVVTGLPLRKNIEKIDKPEWADRFTKIKKPFLYVTGGSQGAHFINKLIENNLTELKKQFKIIHQAGESIKYMDFARLKEKETKTYIVRAHILGNEIGWVLNKANVIVSRAGMNSVCEYIYLRKKALLIPLPRRINPEQIENARLYAETGLGEIIEQEKISGRNIVKEIVDIMIMKQKQSDIIDVDSFKLQSPQAAQKIVEEIEKIN